MGIIYEVRTPHRRFEVGQSVDTSRLKSEVSYFFQFFLFGQSRNTRDMIGHSLETCSMRQRDQS